VGSRGALAAQYHRLVRRRGRNKAAVAVGHSILVIVWHLLQHDCPYVDLASTYFDERDRTATQHRLVRRLEQLGCSVHLDRPAAIKAASRGFCGSEMEPSNIGMRIMTLTP